MTTGRTMFITRCDRLGLDIAFDCGTYEVPFDAELVSESREVTERYEALMRKLSVLYEESRTAVYNEWRARNRKEGLNSD